MPKMLIRYGPLALRQIKKLKPFNKPNESPKSRLSQPKKTNSINFWRILIIILIIIIVIINMIKYANVTCKVSVSI